MEKQTGQVIHEDDHNTLADDRYGLADDKYRQDLDDFHPDPAQVARLRRKIDWRLLPLLSLMYLLSFLDRVNSKSCPSRSGASLPRSPFGFS